MKRKWCAFLIILSIATGVLRLADLLLLSEEGTGFVLWGSVWLRYIIIAIAIFIIYAVSRMQSIKSEIKAINLSPLLLVAIGTISAVAAISCTSYAVRQFVLPTTSFGHALGGGAMLVVAFVVRLLLALTLFTFALFCILLANYKKNVIFEKNYLRTLGLIGAVAFCIIPIIMYSQTPASISRIVYILNVCSALSALVFVTVLLGVMFKKPFNAQKSQIAASGLVCFLMCTCILLPQTLLLYIPFSFYNLFLAILLAFIGVLGAVAALQTSKM